MEVQVVPSPDRQTFPGFIFSETLTASQILKASGPGKFLGCFGRIDDSAPTAEYFLQLFDSPTLPANGATAKAVISKNHTNGTNTAVDWDLRTYGIGCLTGITIVLSTTEFTKTIAGAYLSLNYLWA